jgi:hypothetical protein
MATWSGVRACGLIQPGMVSASDTSNGSPGWSGSMNCLKEGLIRSHGRDGSPAGG